MIKDILHQAYLRLISGNDGGLGATVAVSQLWRLGAYIFRKHVEAGLI